MQKLGNRDTDGNGIFDWEESRWGTNPLKKDSNDDGIPDSVEIAKLKKEETTSVDSSGQTTDEENLTQTDKFSREFFSTVATLNQAGGIDDATVEKLSSSLSDQIKNSAPKKVFGIRDIKISNNDDAKAYKSYSDNLDIIYKKYPIKKSVTTILQEFLENEDPTILTELDPTIIQMTKIINDLVKVSSPQSLSSLHLGLVNGFQRLLENIKDIELLDTDVIVTLSAVSQYEKNVDALEKTIKDLTDIINIKLGN